MKHRVAVTGMGNISALGDEWAAVKSRLETGKNCVIKMTDWEVYDDLNCRLAAPVNGFDPTEHFNRKQSRSMGRVAQMAVVATTRALQQAGLDDDPDLKDGRAGVSYGSSSGSTDALSDFAQMLTQHCMDGLNATTYVRMMSHTAAVNIGVHFGLTGRVIPTSSACTAGSQGIGYAYEAITTGKQKVMVAGGAEALCPSQTAVFDVLYATSTKNDTPELTPRPYDEARDGLVIGEGACTLILEEWEHAKARGANIIAEIVGFGTNSDGTHVTRPNTITMGRAMQLALEDAEVSPDAVVYVNGHGTATEHGDIAETQAVERIFGRPMPISSLKSFTGHTLGACGAFEAWSSINMLNSDWYAPTANLQNIDARCGDLDYLVAPRSMQGEYVMSNNFAFGGINTSLLIKRVS